MTNAWDDLPNAKHIDRVLAHVAAHPEEWHASLDAAWDAARDAVYWDAARDATRHAVWVAARVAVWDATRHAVWDAARDAARVAARCLFAWDDCAYILDLPPDAVRTLAGSGNHAAVLLYPAVQAMYEGDK